MEQQTNANNTVTNLARGLMGAVAGSVLGYFGFHWIIKQGFYPLALPGALLGLGCGVLVKYRSFPLALLCGLLGGVFVEWRFHPFTADGGLDYFLAHLLDLQPITLLMIGLGGVCGFWFALGRKGKSKREGPSHSSGDAF